MVLAPSFSTDYIEKSAIETINKSESLTKDIKGLSQQISNVLEANNDVSVSPESLTSIIHTIEKLMLNTVAYDNSRDGEITQATHATLKKYHATLNAHVATNQPMTAKQLQTINILLQIALIGSITYKNKTRNSSFSVEGPGISNYSHPAT